MAYRKTYRIAQSPDEKCENEAELERMLDILSENLSHHFHASSLNVSDLCVINNTLKAKIGKDYNGYSRMGEFVPQQEDRFMIRWFGSVDAAIGEQIMAEIPGLILVIDEGG